MKELIYVADPMCSWCWGYHPVIDHVHDSVDAPIQYVMGGLARDSYEPMSQETRAYVQDQWRKVTEETGATFNWDFWEVCQPRRSTYPACRAVIAAADQDKTREMFEAIQRAYYQEARNPSDLSTLTDMAREIDLDVDRFTADIASDDVEQELQDGFNVRRCLNANLFPSLIALTEDGQPKWLTKGYATTDQVMDRIHQLSA
ncbi:TPA: DsbA family protein [Candidatus Latescibacteria bacterium]|nr:DsbA family protein [Candidatus Latescibacterota bacterium]|tara:strand:- start:667 stop:1272 length:606 start_codon:yes stop_codon:yes gene_type:complete